MKKRYLVFFNRPFFDTLCVPRPGKRLLNDFYYDSSLGNRTLLEKINYTGKNTGNLMFVESIIKQLGAENCASFYSLKDRSKEFVEANYDAFIIPGSNFLKPAGESFITNGVKPLLDKYDLPFYLIGMGSQMTAKDTIPQDLQSVLKQIAERSKSIGVRGYLSQQILAKIGINNVDVIGCPSVFYSLKKNFRMDKPAFDTDKHIAVNTEWQSRGVEMLLEYIKNQKTLLLMQNEPSFWFDEATMKDGKAIYPQRLSYDKMYWCFKNLKMSDFEKIRDYLHTNSVMFFNIMQWMQFLSNNCSMSFGTRFHGNMVALQAGVPAIWFNHDVRTNELLDLLKLPHVSGNLETPLNFEKIYNDADYEPFNRQYPELYENYLNFLVKNELACAGFDGHNNKVNEVKDSGIKNKLSGFLGNLFRSN